MKSNSSFLYLTIAVICFSLQLHSQSPGGVSSGLVLWLKANAGTNTVSENSPVSSWLDQSPMGNHATQGDPASQPVFTKFAINNNPAVKFTSGTKFLNVDLSDIDNQNFTMYVVAERLSAGSADNFVIGVQQTSPDPGMHMGYSSANTFVFGQYGHTCSTTVTPFNAPTEVPVIMMAEFSQSAGSALREVEDGTTASDTDGNTSSYAQNAQGVIGRGYASAGFDGYIAEVIAFNRILTTAEKKNVETYLAVKYGLTIALGDHDYFAEPGFQWDVAGIGMNSVTQGLNQPKSASESRNEILTISSPASMTNGEYLIWGNDDRPISFVPGDPSDCNLSQVLDRCWMAKETGDVGTVKLEFNLSGFPSVNPNDVMLYIDLDGDGFGDENPIAGTYSNPIKTFAGVNLNNNNRFTIGIGASVYYSVASGNTGSAIWSKTPNGVPVMATFCDKTNFIIQNGHTVTNTVAMMETKDFTINSGATFNAGNNTVSVSGNFSVSGTYNCDNGTVRFEGNNAQLISGTSNLIMNHITCDGSGGVSISSPSVRLKGVLLINAGNFNTNNKLTLQSDANQTGSIGPIAGNLTGTVVVERYYQAASAGWVNICAPIQNKTILDWNDDLITTGFPGSDYPNYPFNNIQRYIESVAGNQDQGYTGTVDVTQQLVNKAGYMAYMNAGLMQLDISGTIFKGVQTLPVSFTNTGNANGDGWNLVANPYPSAINWDQASGWTKTNINNAVYVWDADNQQYASYVNGVSNNGGSPVIPSSQSFWVVANANAPALTINENAKTSSVGVYKNATEEQRTFTLSMSNGMHKDATTMVFDNTVTHSFDPSADAYKISGNSDMPYLCTLLSTGEQLSINSLPQPEGILDMQIVAQVSEDGLYTLSHEGLENFANGACVSLLDNRTGETYILTETNKFQVTLFANDIQPRFTLSVSEPVLKQVNNISCTGKEDGMAVVSGTGSGPWNMIWYNASGETMRIVENVYDVDALTSLSAGNYYVEVENNGACEVTGAHFTILEPEEIFLSAVVKSEGCARLEDGKIELGIEGGTAPFSVTWSNGSHEPVLENIASGNYTAFVTDSQHCTHNLSIWVPVDESLKADFETTAQVYELNNGAVTVPFYNTSEEALEFEWDFGDGTISENDPDASHIYTGEGEYAVKLIARNQDCETFVTKSITVTPKQNQGQLDVNAVLSDIGVLMRFGFDTPKSVRVNAWNVLGQQLMTPIEGVYQNETIHFGERRYFAGSLIEVIDLKTGEKALIRMPVN